MQKLLTICGLLFIATAIFFLSCQKETSFEIGGIASAGTLKGAGSDCLPSRIAGNYEVGKPLVDSVHYLEVTLDIATAGTYKAYTDTVNGVFFKAEGILNTIGAQSVKLKGFGVPIESGFFNFTVHYLAEQCVIQVPFFPAGGGGPAKYTLTRSGDPATCTDFAVAGTYGEGLQLNSSNTVTLKVDVTKAGTYTVTSTTANGMTFSKSSAFFDIGTQAIVLSGSGTPTAAGTHSFTITGGGTTCAFQITTQGKAAFSPDCASAVLSGNYEEKVPMTAGNTVELTLNATTAGIYSITTPTVNGVSFSSSGSLTVGANTVTLTASGTPADAGDFNYTVTGTTSCSFKVTYIESTAPPSKGDWAFKAEGTDFTGTFSTANYALNSQSGMNIATLSGSGPGASSGQLSFTLIKNGGDINSGESYTADVMSSSNMKVVFNFEDSNVKYTSTPSNGNMQGIDLILKVVTHDKTGKKVTGTFSGKLKNASGTLVPITNGTFNLTYP